MRASSMPLAAKDKVDPVYLPPRRYSVHPGVSLPKAALTAQGLSIVHEVPLPLGAA